MLYNESKHNVSLPWGSRQGQQTSHLLLSSSYNFQVLEYMNDGITCNYFWALPTLMSYFRPDVMQVSNRVLTYTHTHTLSLSLSLSCVFFFWLYDDYLHHSKILWPVWLTTQDAPLSLSLSLQWRREKRTEEERRGEERRGQGEVLEHPYE